MDKLTDEEIIKILEGMKKGVFPWFGEEVYDRAITAIKSPSEYKRAYEHLITSFNDRWGEYIKESERLLKEIAINPDDLDVLKQMVELTPKLKLIGDIVCFTEQTLERAKQGEI